MHEGGRTLHHHRDVFYRWNGRCYLECPETELRSLLYPFLDASYFKNREEELIPVRPNEAMVANISGALKSVSHLAARHRGSW